MSINNEKHYFVNIVASNYLKEYREKIMIKSLVLSFIIY